MVGEVAQRLDTAAGRAGTDRDEGRRLAAQLGDLARLLGRADRALDEEDVERTRRSPRGRLGELDDVDPIGDRQEVVLEVEQRQLASVAGGELDDADARSPPRCRAGDGRHEHQRPSTVNVSPSSATENTGPSRQTK